MSADTLLITIPTGMGVDVNVKILDNFATHVAPALGWRPNSEGSVTGYPIEQFLQVASSSFQRQFSMC